MAQDDMDLAGVFEDGGIALRDYFAAAAMQGLLHSSITDKHADPIARAAYDYADAMLRRRAKGEDPGAKAL